jgi:Flp pilus assembly protein TadG
MGFGSDQSRTIGSVGMARWLINHGFAKDESGARAILISIVIVDLIATALIIYFFLY